MWSTSKATGWLAWPAIVEPPLARTTVSATTAKFTGNTAGPDGVTNAMRPMTGQEARELAAELLAHADAAEEQTANAGVTD